jgi:hypothetical protein
VDAAARARAPCDAAASPQGNASPPVAPGFGNADPEPGHKILVAPPPACLLRSKPITGQLPPPAPPYLGTLAHTLRTELALGGSPRDPFTPSMSIIRAISAQCILFQPFRCCRARTTAPWFASSHA